MHERMAKVKKHLTSRSNALLLEDVHLNWLGPPADLDKPLKRKDMIRALLAKAEEAYRAIWLAKNGWDIEDSRDPAKFKAHAKAAAKEPGVSE